MQAQVRLPDQTLEVKFQSGRIVTLEPEERGGRLVIRARDGQVERTILAGAGLENIRRVEIKDFALTDGGTLLVTMAALFPLGVSSRVLGLYPPKGEAAHLPLDAVICYNVAPDEATGVWCLGPALEESWFHRLSGPASGPWSALPRNKLPLIGSEADEPRGAHETGPAGSPALLEEQPGRLAAWIPNAAAVVELNTKTAEVTRWAVPLAEQGKSQMSFAATPQGVLYGLMPKRAGGEPERLDTPYRLMRLNRETGVWVPVPGVPELPRGAALAGMDGTKAVVWKRPTRTLEWVALGPG